MDRFLLGNPNIPLRQICYLQGISETLLTGYPQMSTHSNYVFPIYVPTESYYPRLGDLQRAKRHISGESLRPR